MTMTLIQLNTNRQVEAKIKEIEEAKKLIKNLGDELVEVLNSVDNDTRCDYMLMTVSNNWSTVTPGRACPYGKAHKYLTVGQRRAVKTNSSQWVRNWQRTAHLRKERRG